MRKLNYPVLIALAFAMAFFCLAYPIYVVRPFRHQGPRELAAALAVIQIRPVVTVLASLAAALFLWLYWRSQPRRNGRIRAAAAVGDSTLPTPHSSARPSVRLRACFRDRSCSWLWFLFAVAPCLAVARVLGFRCPLCTRQRNSSPSEKLEKRSSDRLARGSR